MADAHDDALDERSRAILDLERGWWREGVPKARLIRTRLGISPTRYYRVLDRLIDAPAALRSDPMLVKRLRRSRLARRRQRLEGRLGSNGNPEEG